MLNNLRNRFYKQRRKWYKKYRFRYRYTIKPYFDLFRATGKQKIFIIGQNKTGTTSVKKAFEQMGYVVANQRKAEKLLPEYLAGDFAPIVKYCKYGEVFQDIPFSLPETFKKMFESFPNAKFILTVRDDADQWYRSLTRYHSNMFGKGSLPTSEQLKSHPYVYRGWAWQYIHGVYDTPESTPYDEETLKLAYTQFNDEVIHFFENYPDQFLLLNLKEENAFERFVNFLGAKTDLTQFPWENQSGTMKVKI